MLPLRMVDVWEGRLLADILTQNGVTGAVLLDAEGFVLFSEPQHDDSVQLLGKAIALLDPGFASRPSHSKCGKRHNYRPAVAWKSSSSGAVSSFFKPWPHTPCFGFGSQSVQRALPLICDMGAKSQLQA